MSKPVPSAPVTGLAVVISAPSGCGKTTIVSRLLKRHPDWVRSISATTRPAREGEKNGQDYLFVSQEEFKRMKSKGELLESAKVFDQYYGTPKSFVFDRVRDGKCVLLTIDVQGAELLRQAAGPDMPLTSVFVLPPSTKILRERLEGRKTDPQEEIERRIQIAQEEIKEAGAYDLTVVNQNLDEVVQEIERFIDKTMKGRR